MKGCVANTVYKCNLRNNFRYYQVVLYINFFFEFLELNFVNQRDFYYLNSRPFQED